MRDRIASVLARECGWMNRTHCTDDPDADLSLSDIDRMCLAVGVEDEFGVFPPDRDVEAWRSINDVLATVERLTKEPTR